jgi:peptidoglycan/xylan/chitin deacetylase (PgdA/CDA1 family)
MKVMQCWDDGVVTDARLVEIFRRHNAKATFNLNPGLHGKSGRQGKWTFDGDFEVYKLSLDEMKDVYKGFTIAGHSMTHPDLTKLSESEALRELVDCKSFIKDFFGQSECGFAYPYGAWDGNVSRLVEKAGYLYARTCDSVDLNLPLNNPFALPSHCHFLSPDFWDKYERVKAIGGVFYFWGHSYEMKDSKALWSDFEFKIERITSDLAAEWIDVRNIFLKRDGNSDT